MLPDKASGTFTFLFTDIEGSTRLWERFPQAMRRALERHDSILLTAVTAAGGQVVKTTGDGLMAVFGSAAEAVRACLAGQRGLMEESWPETGALRVRMGLHSGEAQLRGGRLLRSCGDPWRADHGGRSRRPGAAVRHLGRPGGRPAPGRRRPGGPRRAPAQGSRAARGALPAGPSGAPSRLPAAGDARPPTQQPAHPGLHLHRTRHRVAGDPRPHRARVGASAHPDGSGRHRQDPPRAPGGRRRDRPVRRRRVLHRPLRHPRHAGRPGQHRPDHRPDRDG